jgi:hypothetical protein
MQCSFCPNPAAHPSTGCVYGPRTIACADCTRSFWRWALSHVNRPPRKNGADFYAAAGKWKSESPGTLSGAGA